MDINVSISPEPVAPPRTVTITMPFDVAARLGRYLWQAYGEQPETPQGQFDDKWLEALHDGIEDALGRPLHGASGPFLQTDGTGDE